MTTVKASKRCIDIDDIGIYDNYALESAIKNGHLKVVKYLENNFLNI